ncbi:hypothetical protein AMTRI_Chr07g75710 [Amborella trichopoda]
MKSQVCRSVLGLVFIVAVAIIWIAASFIVQAVVDSGVSPFLITYICNSLFIVYIPIIEIARYWEDSIGSLWNQTSKGRDQNGSGDSETINLLGDGKSKKIVGSLSGSQTNENSSVIQSEDESSLLPESELQETELLAETPINSADIGANVGDGTLAKGLDSKGRWTRRKVAMASLWVCPFWFLAQLTFNLSLKYTTVTSNTILSSVSSLFTFLVALAFLGEKFTWVKLFSVLLCMAGTVIVSFGDSETGENSIATNPVLGDILALVSAGLYAVYITLIRKKLPDENKGEGQASMAQFLGFLGLFNLLLFLPVALILNFTHVEPFHNLTWNQLGLIVGKGLLDNVLSDYLWAKAVLLTTTTVATAGLTIQVPLAAVVDSLTGHAPNLLDYLGGASIMAGFIGINIPSADSCGLGSNSKETLVESDPQSTPTVAQHPDV